MPGVSFARPRFASTSGWDATAPSESPCPLIRIGEACLTTASRHARTLSVSHCPPVHLKVFAGLAHRVMRNRSAFAREARTQVLVDAGILDTAPLVGRTYRLRLYSLLEDDHGTARSPRTQCEPVT
jgi:hypothetical protein